MYTPNNGQNASTIDVQQSAGKFYEA